MRIEGDHCWQAPFDGAKAALIHGQALAVLRRDDRPDIPSPNMIDLPGGGREGAETPLDCVRREIQEEIGLDVTADQFRVARPYRASSGAVTWFLVAGITREQATGLRLGDEGQACWMMDVQGFLADPEAITSLQDRLRRYLASER